MADSGSAPLVAAALAAGVTRHEVFTELLAELGSPAVVVIEDVHWADDATLDLLRFVGRRLDRCRSVVVATYRVDEVDAHRGLRVLMGDLATASGCRRLFIEPLSVDGVRQLCAGQPLDPVRLHAVTGGNPFYVTEVLAAPGWAVPPTVADAVAARVSRLTASARAAVDVVSIEPSRMARWLAISLLRDADGLAAAVAAGMLVEAGDGVRFRHELARRAVEEWLDRGRRAELHGRALAELEHRHADPARLAHHAEGAGDGEGVLRWAPEAARRAVAAGASREAIEQYERALRHVRLTTSCAGSSCWMPVRRCCSASIDRSTAWRHGARWSSSEDRSVTPSRSRWLDRTSPWRFGSRGEVTRPTAPSPTPAPHWAR